MNELQQINVFMLTHAVSGSDEISYFDTFSDLMYRFDRDVDTFLYIVSGLNMYGPGIRREMITWIY